MNSPLLHLPDAVAGEGVDAGVAAHYGSFNSEQRTLASGDGFVDLSHRGVVRVEGPDRLAWLHSLTTQQLEGIAPGVPVTTLVLSPQGHVEHALYGVDDGTAFTAHVEPGRAGRAGRVARPDAVPDAGRGHRRHRRPRGGVAPGRRRGRHDLVPRDQLAAYADAAGPACGTWAYEALRIARGEPRLGSGHRPPHDPQRGGLGRSRPALGRAPGQGLLPRPGDGRPRAHAGPTAAPADAAAPRRVGEPAARRGHPARPRRPPGRCVGSSARHWELGPIALGLVKRNVSLDATLDAEGMPVAQEMVVDPELGLHVRPKLR